MSWVAEWGVRRGKVIRIVRAGGRARKASRLDEEGLLGVELGGLGGELAEGSVGGGNLEEVWLEEGCVGGGKEEGRKTKGMVPARPVVLVQAWGMEREVRWGRR